MSKITLTLEESSFQATHIAPQDSKGRILFAVGSGGNPERHLPLLNALAESGFSVIAPHFERITTPTPSAQDLYLRANVLKFALDRIAEPGVPFFGVGHSIGATLLLAMAGGQMWLRKGECLDIPAENRLKKLSLFAPPTGFFQAPNALDKIQIPLQIWAGKEDNITPPAQVEFLKNLLPKHVLVDMHLVEGAGHFSFMNSLPPQIIDPMKDRENFLSKLASEVVQFLKK